MRTQKLILAAVAAAAIAAQVSSPAYAEDIDLFSVRSGSTAAPNLMLIVDSAANSNASMGACKYKDGTSPPDSKSLDNYKCALDHVVADAKTTASGDARVRLGIVDQKGLFLPLTPLDDKAFQGSYTGPLKNKSGLTNRQAISVAVKALTQIPGNANQGGSFHETWAYYTGGNGPGTATGENSGTTYTTGTTAIAGCQRNFNLFLSGITQSAHTASDSDTERLKSAVDNAISLQWLPSTMKTNMLSRVPSTEKGWAIEWARFMYTTDMIPGELDKQNIITYSIGAVAPNKRNAGFEAFIANTARYGGGQAFTATSYEEIYSYILRVLNDIQTRDSVFASASLPVSVNAQGTYQNQVFMGVFRPESGGRPRWLGNLKQYEFKYDTVNRSLSLVDAAGEPAVSNSGSGFLSPNAISFWTSKNTTVEPDLGGGFWRVQPDGVGAGYDSPDGENVEKGGVAQVLRNANLLNDYQQSAGSTKNPRRLSTYCPSGTGCNKNLMNSANAFEPNNNGINFAGVTDDAARKALINWVRGQDNAGNEISPDPKFEKINVRPSIHGDVLHSRPAVINYGGSLGTVVFYGANDGIFRAINGNRSNPSNSPLPASGSELWGVVFPEFFDKLKRQRENSPLLKLPSTQPGITPEPQRKDYFADGGIGVYQVINDQGVTTKARIYPTMRRGGRFLYGLGVTDPQQPEVLWRISNASSKFSELGYTWSQPKVARVRGHSTPVLIFAGGYDLREDEEPPTANTMGRAIYVVDAESGAHVWSVTHGSADACSGDQCTRANMKWSIPSDVSLMDTDRDGYVDRLYVGDTGGNLWRVDFEPSGTAPSDWTVSQLAALGCTSGACTAGTPRKFFYPPEVVPQPEYDAVFIGSGDREHPLYDSPSYGVADRFFMVRDSYKGKSGANLHSVNIESNLLEIGSDKTYNGGGKGYYLPLTTGEKVVNAPTVVAGIVYFGTNIPVLPTSNSCAGLGTAMGYAIGAITGKVTSRQLDGGGFPPTAVAGVVNVGGGSDGVVNQVPFCLGCISTTDNSCNSAICASRPPIPVPTNRTKRYWSVDRR